MPINAIFTFSTFLFPLVTASLSLLYNVTYCNVMHLHLIMLQRFGEPQRIICVLFEIYIIL